MMKALERLRQSVGPGEGRAIYELIMLRRFGLTRTDILLGKDTTLCAKDKEVVEEIVARVAAGEPVQYVLGTEEFCGRQFLVTPDVLIPRPETQLLVELVREHVPKGSAVLDVGTGSGCIAITLALDGYRAVGLDVSASALNIARLNAQKLGAHARFVEADILHKNSGKLIDEACGSDSSSVPLQPSQSAASALTCIVSNPPYICFREASAMDVNVKRHEPGLALYVPDDDPLLFYRAIAGLGQSHLAAGGYIFFEVNALYAQEVCAMLTATGYKEVRINTDQFDKERFVWARKM